MKRLNYIRSSPVIYAYMIQSQGLMHDTYVYGLNVKGILSTLISPLEVLMAP